MLPIWRHTCYPCWRPSANVYVRSVVTELVCPAEIAVRELLNDQANAYDVVLRDERWKSTFTHRLCHTKMDKDDE